MDDGLTYSTSLIGWTEIDGVKYLVTGEGLRITFDRESMDIFIKRCQEKAKRKEISFPRILSKEEYEKETASK